MNMQEAKREQQQRINMPELDRIYREHPTLYQLTRDNVEIHSWLKMASIGACTVEEALIGAAVRLAETNKKQFDEIIELKMKEARK
jgi:hypothetical protein